jgi:hypothetical protein
MDSALSTRRLLVTAMATLSFLRMMITTVIDFLTLTEAPTQ